MGIPKISNPAQVLNMRGELPTHPTERYRWRVERYGADVRRNRLYSVAAIRRFVVHHTGIEVPYQGPKIFARNTALAHIRRGYPGAGYLGGTDRTGINVLFWPWWVWTWHCGWENPRSVGWVAEGHYDRFPVPEALQHGLEVAYYMTQHEVDKARQDLRLPPVVVEIVGHRETQGAATICPGDYGMEAVEKMRRGG